MFCKPLAGNRGISGFSAAHFSTFRSTAPASFRRETHLQKELASYLQQKRRIQPTKPPRTSIQRPQAMAFFLPGLRRGLMLSTPLILSTPLLVQSFKRPVLCEGPDPLSKITSDIRNSYAREAQTPIIKTSGAPNPRAIRQISMGSILGVLAGLGVSVFSKPLAILIGLGIVCVQVRTQANM